MTADAAALFTDVQPAAPERRLTRGGTLAALLRALRGSRLSMAGTGMLVALAAVGLMAPVLAPPENPARPYEIPRDGFKAEPQPPSAQHPFGTTQGQYDIFYGLVWGTRTAFKVGILVTLLVVLLGTGLGAATAYAGGWVDELFQRLVELLSMFPGILAIITLSTLLTAVVRERTTATMIALVVFGWLGYARLVRADVLATKERDYVLAGRALGASGWQILRRHILPNSLFSVLVLAFLSIGEVALAFAGLSFVGLGAPEGTADWGWMLGQARNWVPDLASYWWVVLFPTLAILLFIVGWNLLGDAFRDALDPRLSRR